MSDMDKRNRLDEKPFSYRSTKSSETLLLYYHEKHIKTLKGKEAMKCLKKLESAENEKERQLILAKATGNFKRGNEREKYIVHCMY
ncbi:hypothetical protein [Cytobacillus purgationiresistens]|uniref:hypothetical protein n=1 Tax=Cytobacillus purgationiresistens TaxID=863449 RepID=UPI0027D8BA8A|nr:hypothetical protein [Cytobacillus purgationiresistens]